MLGLHVRTLTASKRDEDGCRNLPPFEEEGITTRASPEIEKHHSAQFSALFVDKM
jgi:hypothetical protein